MKLRITMDNGREFIVSARKNIKSLDQFIWTCFEKNDNLINKLITLDIEDAELALNPTRISSIEVMKRDNTKSI